MIIAIAHRLRRQRGVISLLTLGFMVGAGMTLLVTLWGIARVTGAFNTLYTANEAASYAALSASDVEPGGLIKVRCQNLDDTICKRTGAGASITGDDALSAAEAVMEKSLQSRPFGLCYDGEIGGTCRGPGEVKLIADFAGSPAPSIKVFNMGGTSRDQILRCLDSFGQSKIPANQDLKPSPSGGIDCWGLGEYGQVYSPNFNTGVITRAKAEIEFFPGCLNGAICPSTEVRVASSASQDQPVPGNTSWGN